MELLSLPSVTRAITIQVLCGHYKEKYKNLPCLPLHSKTFFKHSGVIEHLLKDFWMNIVNETCLDHIEHFQKDSGINIANTLSHTLMKACLGHIEHFQKDSWTNIAYALSPLWWKHAWITLNIFTKIIEWILSTHCHQSMLGSQKLWYLYKHFT